MRDDIGQQLVNFFGGLDALVGVLRIGHLPEDTQLLIIERFADVLFKRILLFIPESEQERVCLELKTSSEVDAFTQVLTRAIPDIDSRIREEIRRGVAEFQLPETPVATAQT